jgi:hypothetical protein
MQNRSAKITVTLEKEFFEKNKAQALAQFNENRLQDDEPDTRYEFVFEANPDDFDVRPKRLIQNFDGNGIAVHVNQEFNADFLTRLSELIIKTFNRAKANFETVKEID